MRTTTSSKPPQPKSLNPVIDNAILWIYCNRLPGADGGIAITGVPGKMGGVAAGFIMNSGSRAGENGVLLDGDYRLVDKRNFQLKWS